MKTFGRYFLHFVMITLLLATLLFIIGEPRLTIKQAIIYFAIIVVFFVFPMSIFFSYQASLDLIELTGDADEIIRKLSAAILKKTHRVIVSENDTTIIYAYQFKQFPLLTHYGRWLTNSITITRNSSTVTIEAPKAVLNLLKQSYN